MMHDVHAPLPATATDHARNIDADPAAAAAAAEHPASVWWTVMDFVRAAVEAKASHAATAARPNVRLASEPSAH